jgi:hypothetical protein
VSANGKVVFRRRIEAGPICKKTVQSKKLLLLLKPLLSLTGSSFPAIPASSLLNKNKLMYFLFTVEQNPLKLPSPPPHKGSS